MEGILITFYKWFLPKASISEGDTSSEVVGGERLRVCVKVAT